MKKVLAQLLLFLLLSLLFIDWGELGQSITGAKISGPLPLFPAVQIRLLESNDPKLKAEALTALKKTLVRYYFPALAAEPWQAEYLLLDLCGGENPPRPEAAVALSLPPDKALLVILAPTNSSYHPVAWRNDLRPLLSLSKTSLPDGKELLISLEKYRSSPASQAFSGVIKFWLWEENGLTLLAEKKYAGLAD